MATLSEQCVCGAAFSTASLRYGKAVRLHAVFTAKHNNCITASSDEEHPSGDVYAQAERAGQHSLHELQIGFQREDRW